MPSVHAFYWYFFVFWRQFKFFVCTFFYGYFWLNNSGSGCLLTNLSWRRISFILHHCCLSSNIGLRRLLLSTLAIMSWWLGVCSSSLFRTFNRSRRWLFLIMVLVTWLLNLWLFFLICKWFVCTVLAPRRKNFWLIILFGFLVLCCKLSSDYLTQIGFWVWSLLFVFADSYTLATSHDSVFGIWFFIIFLEMLYIFQVFFCNSLLITLWLHLTTSLIISCCSSIDILWLNHLRIILFLTNLLLRIIEPIIL